MKVVDASSIVLAWDIYPIIQFPTFWEWMESQVTSGTLVMAEPNYIEVSQVSPDCHQWLSSYLSPLPVTNAIVGEALKITEALGIIDDDYHPSGVDENDVFCIATAKAHHFEVMSDEALQTSLPGNLKKYKIPAVCNILEVSIPCQNLNTFIRNSNVTF